MTVSYITGLTRSRSNVGGTTHRLKAYPCRNGNHPVLYAGTPVRLSLGGLKVALNTTAVLGVAKSFGWVDKTTGQPQYSQYIPANTSSKNSTLHEGFTSPFALVDDNPHGTWIIASDLSVSAGQLGTLARVTNGAAGSAVTKRSTCEVDPSGTTVSAGDAMFRIMDVYRISEITSAGGEDNSWNSPSTLFEVVFSNHLYG